MQPKVKNDQESLHVAPNHYVYRRKHDSLVESTGHRKVAGRWFGNDKFYVYSEEEKPGFGEQRDFEFNSESWQPEGVSLDSSSRSWRPTLARFYSIGAGSTNSGLDDTGFPEPTIPPYSDYTLQLNSKGTKFIRDTRPGNPIANLAQSLIELRDLPRLPRTLYSRAGFLKQLGSEYLNLEFGWLSTLRDAQKLYNATKVIDDRLEQLRRDNGKRVKRRRNLGKDTDTTDTLCEFDVEFPFDWTFGVDGPNLPEQAHPDLDNLNCFKCSALRGMQGTGEGSLDASSPAHFKLTRRTVETYRGHCTYQWYIPDTGSLQWSQRAREALFGGRITPAILYDVYPWTWLIGWCTNVSDIIDNLSSNAVDNLVLHNPCITYHKNVIYEAELTVSWNALDDNFNQIHIPPGNDVLKWRRESHTKIRHPASPFGFGIDDLSLSLKQLAILAALATQGKQLPLNR